MINAIRALRLCQLGVVVCVLAMILVTIPVSCVLLASKNISIDNALTDVGLIYGLLVAGALLCLFCGGL